MRCEALHRKCSRDHAHVRIEGKFTKPSATYVEGLAEEIARVFVLHLQRLDVLRQEKGLDVRGLEDPLSDDLCLGLDWKVLGSWRWKKPSHINVLETAAALKVWAHVAREGGDKRFTFLSDSHVSRSVLVRGRSSSDSLRPLLRRAAALCVAYGLYPAGRFVPTRWNPADAASRGGDLSEKAVCSIIDGLSVQEIAAVASIRGLRRWAANWARLVLLTCPGLVDFLLHPGRRHPNLPISPREWFMDFDATLGYPGEGPLRLPLALFLLLLICQASLWIVLAAPRGSFRHGDDDRKARRTGLQLGDGRRVTELTSFTRANLYAAFLRWLEEKQFPWDETLFCSPPDIDGVNKILVDYGRWLFSEGKPYYHFSETVNAVTCKRPLIRRSLQQVWDLAFIWGSYEPTVHHLAMPPQILTAVLAVCLVWGWVREAAIFALAWGALLRIGEIFQARRCDLILPTDVGESVSFCLLRISEPKTRFRAARHQAGKLEQPDLIHIVQLGLKNLRKDQKLWELSGATLRARLSKVLEKLKLPSANSGSLQALSLASFRPGGATWLITQTESAETVRRRGRWASFRVMECYLQEVAATTYMTDISENARQNVLQAVEIFPKLLGRALRFNSNAIPSSTWYFLFSKAKETV